MHGVSQQPHRDHSWDHLQQLPQEHHSPVTEDINLALLLSTFKSAKANNEATPLPQRLQKVKAGSQEVVHCIYKISNLIFIFDWFFDETV